MYLAFTIPCLLALLSTNFQAAEPEFRVVGYLPEYRAAKFDAAAANRRKVAYAREKGLGGVMVWELGQDAEGEGSLLRVIRMEVEKKR